MKFKRIITVIIAVVGFGFLGNLSMFNSVFADDEGFSFSLSPMTQSIVLMPGDTYNGSFKIVNPSSSRQDLNYNIEVRSFYVDDDYATTYDENNSPIVDWTTIKSAESGSVAPNNNTDVYFSIDVPAQAPAGGQYLAFRVLSQPAGVVGEVDNGAAIQEQLVITHLIFAEIAGDTYRNGEITDVSVPSFLLSDNIYGESTIRNTGNIHGVATYKLQVFPLFSNEEVYTNEEDPERKTILPDRALYNKTTWTKTPEVGIFNVKYTVEFEGVTTEVSKLVIKCPIWLLFIIALVVVALIIWIIVRVRSRKKSRKSEE